MTLPIPKLLEYYYKNSSVLFLGCSLNNDRIVQVFRVIKQKVGDIVIPQRFTVEEAPETEQELVARNEYLLRLGIIGIWFEKNQFDCIEGVLRLARNELRYRGVFPGGAKTAAEAVIHEPTTAQGLIGRLLNRVFAYRRGGSMHRRLQL